MIKSFEEHSLNEAKITNKDFKKNINHAGKELEKDYAMIIDERLPYIAIASKDSDEWKKARRDGEEEAYIKEYSFFGMQGDEAQEMIDMVPDNITPKRWMLWYLQSAGALG